MVAGGVIEAMLISYDSDVRKITEEDESAKLESLFRGRCYESGP